MVLTLAVEWIRNHWAKALGQPDLWITVTCPVCCQLLEVEPTSGGLHAPEVRCTCGTIINNELGYFSQSQHAQAPAPRIPQRIAHCAKKRNKKDATSRNKTGVPARIEPPSAATANRID